MDLVRHGSLPGIGTFGELFIGVHKFHTVEREWLDNKPFESCIPTGLYALEKHNSNQYPNTFALVGDTVSHYQSEKERYTCLIHIANWPSNVTGCIGIGLSLAHINGQLGVSNSGAAMIKFRQLMVEDTEHTRILEISHKEIDYGS